MDSNIQLDPQARQIAHNPSDISQGGGRLGRESTRQTSISETCHAPIHSRGSNSPAFSVVWAMPSRWTFQIPPIANFVARWLKGCAVVVDPFCGESTLATHGNDLGRGGVDAAEFALRLLGDGVQADAVLFDPPYSPRQIAECYKAIGRQVTQQDTQSSALYARVRRPLGDILRPGGVALSFGWQSGGFGKAWPTEEIMLVQHGGGHNDTICVAQRKPF